MKPREQCCNTLVLLVFLLGGISDNTSFAQESEILKGKTEITRPADSSEDWVPPLSGNPYRPVERSILRGNRYVEQYKLVAARELFLKTLQQNPISPGAHNGLGKVYYYLTTSSDQSVRDRAHSLKEDAIDEFLTALRYRPNYVEARLNLGTVYLEEGRLNDAVEEFTTAYRLAPRNSEVNEKMGIVRFNQGDLSEAERFLQRAIRLNSKNASAHYQLGVVYAESERYSDALDELQISLSLYPNAAPVHYELGWVYEKQGNGSASVNEFKKALLIKPEFRLAAEKLAEHYEKRGDYALALEQLKNTQESYPEDLELLQHIGNLSLKVSQPEIARQFYEAVLEKNPDDLRAKQGVSESERLIAKLSLGDGDLASRAASRERLTQSLTYNPDNFKAKLAHIHLTGRGTANPAETRSEIQAVLKNSAKLPSENLDKGELLLKKFQFDASTEEFRTAILNPTDLADTLLIGEMIALYGDLRTSQEAYQKVLILQPENSAARLGLEELQQIKTRSSALLQEGKLYLRNGDTKQGIERLNNAIELNKRNDQAHLKLGELYEQQKRYELAIIHYQAYLDLQGSRTVDSGILKKIRRLKEILKESS